MSSVSNINVSMPTSDRNYCKFDGVKVLYYLSKKEDALPLIDQTLKSTNDEKEVCEALYIADRLIENGVKGVDKMYPTFARFNDTKSPNIQTFLAGIYRKTKVPDAFGPLWKMLIQNSINQPKEPQLFDPNEEIGGAILEYMA
ncbi:MAG: hypothetical protein K6E29_01075 [Cyanobacteria bacterium RUI128]|nr:hypothetical protein [Cyanobacteria bacterium RUI128]